MITDSQTSPPNESAGEESPATSATGAGCGVHQAPRTFVGFAERQTLDDFERTAAEAERLLAAVKLELCALKSAQDRDGTLRAALSGGQVEITAVRFTRKDLTSANVDVRTLAPDGSADTGSEVHWLAHVKRRKADWRVESVARR
jgi:hypothetical protein